MKSIFIITSCLIPAIGVFSPEDRLKQTLETVDSIRKKSPDSFIILSDVSIQPLTNKYYDLISKVDLFFDLSKHDFLVHFTNNGMKSQGECGIMHVILSYLKQTPQLLEGVDRVFKITGRLQLDDGFDINDYVGLYGKYVFKKRIPTWMSVPIHGATHVFDTRLWSMSTSLIDTHITALDKVFTLLGPLDLEHAYFAVLDKEKIVEFDRVYCRGQVASTGEWKFD